MGAVHGRNSNFHAGETTAAGEFAINIHFFTEWDCNLFLNLNHVRVTCACVCLVMGLNLFI